MLESSEIEALASIIAKKITPMFKPWLSLREAADAYHIGEHRLIALATAGKIKGFRDPDTKRKDWLFSRESLDKYRDDQAPITYKEKALAIMNGQRI